MVGANADVRLCLCCLVLRTAVAAIASTRRTEHASCTSPHDAVCLDCAAVGAPSCCDQGGCIAVQPYSGAELARACHSMCRPVSQSPRAAVAVRFAGGVVAETLPQYLSVDLDWWHNTTHDCAPGQGRTCWGNAGALWLDLDHPRVRGACAALSPGLLRIGGSLDNYVKYLVGNMTPKECRAPFGPVKGQMWDGLCLNMSRWDAIHRFTRDVGLDLIFGLGYPNPAAWDPANARALLEYTSRHNYSLFGVELGEEMAPRPGTKPFEHMIAAYATLREVIHTLPWRAQAAPPLVLGPCVGMGNEEAGPGFVFTAEFLRQTLDDGSIDAVVVHSYNNDGGENWHEPGFLGQTRTQAERMLQETRKHSPSAQVWCGECGPHNAGGLPNITDRFISSFYYADALGGLAKLGLAQFGRQALVGGNYGLLQEQTYEPNPDLYTAVTWKRLMGKEVLNVTVGLQDASPEAPDVGSNNFSNATEVLHIYAHCEAVSHWRTRSQRHGGVARGVTLLFISVSSHTEYALSVPGADLTSVGKQTSSRREWHFTGPDIYSRTVLLNGRPLLPQATGGLPALAPKMVPGNEPILVQPLSYGFAVLDVACPV